MIDTHKKQTIEKTTTTKQCTVALKETIINSWQVKKKKKLHYTTHQTNCDTN